MPGTYYKTDYAILTAIQRGATLKTIEALTREHVTEAGRERLQTHNSTREYILKRYRELTHPGSDRAQLAAELQHFTDQRKRLAESRAGPTGGTPIRLRPISGKQYRTITLGKRSMLLHPCKLSTYYQPATREDAEALRDWLDTYIDSCD